jgi:hypothetical protein
VYVRLSVIRHGAGKPDAPPLARNIAAGSEWQNKSSLHPFFLEGFHRLSKFVFLSNIRARAESDEGLVKEIRLVELTREQGIAILDITDGILQVNSFTPL